MYLKQLKLSNFRSWQEGVFRFDKGLNFIVGPNASGKTNILEAIFFLATTTPFSGHYLSDLIAKNSSESHLEAIVHDSKGYQHLLNLNFLKNNQAVRQAYFLAKTRVSRKKFRREFDVLLFEPRDLQFISGQPARRRQMIDRFLASVDWDYAHNLLVYRKILRQRNNLLLRIKNSLETRSHLWPWNRSLIRQSNFLQKKRHELINFFNLDQEKKDSPVRLSYQKSYLSEELINQPENIQREIEAGATLWGAHRDDYLFLWDNQPLNRFGSRGQQRLAYLNFLISQKNWLETIKKERPIFLLDDVFSELDSNYIKAFLDKIKDNQVIITSIQKPADLEGHLISTSSLS